MSCKSAAAERSVRWWRVKPADGANSSKIVSAKRATRCARLLVAVAAADGVDAAQARLGVVRDSGDSDDLGRVGECEELINLMRRECGLAERAEYFFTPLPGTWHGEFKSRLVRLAFERCAQRQTKRYWLVWDATLVVGLDRAAR